MLHSKVAMKGLGRGKNVFNTTSLIFSLAFQLIQTDEAFKVNGHNTHSSNENVSLHVGEYEIENSKYEILLGVKLDSKLNFDDQ